MAPTGPEMQNGPVEGRGRRVRWSGRRESNPRGQLGNLRRATYFAASPNYTKQKCRVEGVFRKRQKKLGSHKIPVATPVFPVAIPCASRLLDMRETCILS